MEKSNKQNTKRIYADTFVMESVYNQDGQRIDHDGIKREDEYIQRVHKAEQQLKQEDGMEDTEDKGQVKEERSENGQQVKVENEIRVKDEG